MELAVKKSVADVVLQPLLFAWLCVEALLSSVGETIGALAAYIRIWRFAAKFPVGEKTWPLLGHVPSLLSFNGPDSLNFMIKTVSKNTSGVMWFGIIPVFYVWNPRDAERVLCNIKTQAKPQIYGLFENALGKGLVTASGQLWHRHHKIIAPTFHAKILDSFVPIFNSQVDVFIDILRGKADGEVFDIFHMTERLTVDIICETAMGINLKVQTDSEQEYSKALGTVQECIQQRLMRPWLHSPWLYALSSVSRREEAGLKITRGVRNRVIRERKISLQSGDLTSTGNGENRRLAFLDHLLLSVKAGAHLTDQEIAEEVDTFMAAGADTTSVLISYTLLEMARHPNVQEKAVEELQSLYDASSPTIDVTPNELSRMTYLEMVLKETLRLHPPVPTVVRRAGEDIRLATSDLIIPANAQVAVAMVITHRCADYYSCPDKFDPERFLPERSGDRHPFAFIPFSAGQRACIGRRLSMLEAKTVVAKALWHFEFTPDPNFEPRDSWGITMKPTNGVRLRVHRRK